MDAIDYQPVPGTIHLVDTEGTMDEPHAATENYKDVILIPTPSNDPKDPLNWSHTKKMMTLVCLAVYTCGVSIISNATLSTPTGKSGTRADFYRGSGDMFLLSSLGCLIFHPLALQFGKKPVYLFSIIAMPVLSMWSIISGSNSGSGIFSVIQGLLAAPMEFLPMITISDIFFEHEKVPWINIYAFYLFIFNFISPAVIAHIKSEKQFQSLSLFFTICGVASSVIVLFFMEETNFQRAPTSIPDVDEEVDSQLKSGSTELEQPPKYESYEDVEARNRKNGNIEEKPSSKFLLFYYITEPFKMAIFPTVIAAGVFYGLSSMVFVVVNAIESASESSVYPKFILSARLATYIFSIFLSSKDYSFCYSLLKNLKVLVGCRKDGITQAEDGIRILLFFVFFTSVGFLPFIVLGFITKNHWYSYVYGISVLGTFSVLGCTISVVYVLDSYREMGSGALVAVIVIRNLITYFTTSIISPSVQSFVTGSVSFMPGLFMILACTVCAYSMAKTGECWRKRTSYRYWRFVQRKRKLGAN